MTANHLDGRKHLHQVWAISSKSKAIARLLHRRKTGVRSLEWRGGALKKRTMDKMNTKAAEEQSMGETVEN